MHAKHLTTSHPSLLATQMNFDQQISMHLSPISETGLKQGFKSVIEKNKHSKHEKRKLKTIVVFDSVCFVSLVRNDATSTCWPWKDL